MWYKICETILLLHLFTNPLAEVGSYPSASSSDDKDGDPRGHGVFPCGDSSNAEENSHAFQRISSLHVLSADDTVRRCKPTLQAASRKSVACLNSDGYPMEGDKSDVLRQILHFTELRQRRPIFLRNDQISEEDMLLISAVEEADGFTTVGVELMHVLRYIFYGKLGRRQEDLQKARSTIEAMQRMLRGYYQRTRANHDDTKDRYTHIEDAQTLGGLLARFVGDVYDAHPALIGHYSHYKLVGVYDQKIQKLANSRTVQVVLSCLVYACASTRLPDQEQML